MTAPRRAAKPVQEPLPLSIAEGVHLNLPEDAYFDQHALGSSDFHVLATDTPSWWYDSSYNPERREQRRRSRALVFGSALHALILEGEAAYARRFVVQPDPESTQYADNRLGMLKLLQDRGVHISKRDSFDPAKLNEHIRRAGIAHLVRQTANADYEAAKRAGRNTLSEDEDRRLRRMAHQVAQHPDLGPNLKKGLSEVSVFWRPEDRPEILLRARFDKLLPNFTIDLKTFSNPRDESPEEATLQAIQNEGYDLQAEHYREARRQLAHFVAEKRVFNWSAEGGPLRRETVLPKLREELEAIAGQQSWTWVWIFYQVQSDDAGRAKAPVLVPWYTPPSGELFDNARATINRALDNYQQRVRAVGLAQPWAEIHPIRPLPLDRLKRLAFKRTQQ